MATAVVSYKQKYENAIARAKRLAEQGKAPIEAGMQSISGLTGGIAAGFLDAKLPKVGPAPLSPLVGGAAVLGSLVYADEGWAKNLNAFGTTMLGVFAARETYRLLTT